MVLRRTRQSVLLRIFDFGSQTPPFQRILIFSLDSSLPFLLFWRYVKGHLLAFFEQFTVDLVDLFEITIQVTFKLRIFKLHIIKNVKT